jgi:hypothetical protein
MSTVFINGPLTQDQGTTWTWTLSNFSESPGALVIVPQLVNFDSELGWGNCRQTFPYGQAYQSFIIDIFVTPSKNALGATFYLTSVDIAS